MVTLSKLNPENNQEVFDFVIEKLYHQGKKSESERENSITKYCVYRSKDGCKCAVGHLIPYDMYTAKMEGYTIYGLINDEITDKKLKKVSDYLKKFDIRILSFLQRIHDFSKYDGNFIECLWENLDDWYLTLTEEYKINFDHVNKLKAEYTQSQKG